MFAYCGNNPVNNMDPYGCAFVSISIKNKKTNTYDFMPEKQTMPPYADHPNVIESSSIIDAEKLVCPTESKQVNSDFGYRSDPITGETSDYK